MATNLSPDQLSWITQQTQRQEDTFSESGAGSYTPSFAYDKASQRAYMPVYGNTSMSPDGNNSPSLMGYRGYYMPDDMYDWGKSKSQMNGTAYDMYDANGAFTGQGMWENIRDTGGFSDYAPFLMAALPFAAGVSPTLNAALSFGTNPVLGAGAAAGGAGAVGAGAGASAAGVGEAGWGMDLGMEGLAGATPSSGMGATFAGSAGGLVPAGSAAGAGTALGAASGGGGLTLSQIASGAKTAAGLMGLGASGGDLGRLVSGGIDAHRQGEAADKLLEWLKSRTAITDNLYQPGTPEYNQLWDEMSRKDAAAGRNSQYGPRSVELAAKIAQIKSAENTKMTTGIGEWMKGAYDQDAAKYSGLLAALGGATGGSSGGLLDLISRYYSTNSVGNSVYDAATNSGGFSGTSLGDFFYGNGTGAD